VAKVQCAQCGGTEFRATYDFPYQTASYLVEWGTDDTWHLDEETASFNVGYGPDCSISCSECGGRADYIGPDTIHEQNELDEASEVELVEFGEQLVARIGDVVEGTQGAPRVDSTVTETRPCRGCGRPIPERPGSGRQRDYCSNACRQRAYRQRADSP
jgi:hypothetical protein